MSDIVKGLLGVGAIVLFIIVVTLVGRSESANVCPVVIRDPRVIEKYGASLTCAFKSSGWGQTAVRVTGDKGSGIVVHEGGRVTP